LAGRNRCACIAPMPADATHGIPQYWRIACNAPTNSSFHLCDVWFFSDRACTLAPPAFLQQRVSSAAKVEQAGPANMVYREWKSACSVCGIGEAFLGVRFSDPVVVQCVSFSNCPVASTGVLSNQSSSCGEIVLERSADGVAWSQVAAWTSPIAGQPFSLDSASFRMAQLDPPMLLGWYPPAGNCTTCDFMMSNVNREILELNFSQPIYVGDGSITFERGSWPTLRIPSFNTAWFRIQGTCLQISPQTALGPPASCAKVSIDAHAVVGVNGEPHKLAQPYEYCIEDTTPPSLQGVEPPNSSVVSNSQHEMHLFFNEPVRIASESLALVAHMIVARSNANFKRNVSLNLAGNSTVVRGRIGSKNVRVDLGGGLETAASFRLIIPTGIVVDLAGNLWSEKYIFFSTEPNQAVSAQTQGGATWDGLHIVSAAVAVGCICFLVLCFGMICRVYRKNTSQQCDCRFKGCNAKQAKSPHFVNKAFSRNPGGPRQASWADTEDGDAALRQSAACQACHSKKTKQDTTTEERKEQEEEVEEIKREDEAWRCSEPMGEGHDEDGATFLNNSSAAAPSTPPVAQPVFQSGVHMQRITTDCGVPGQSKTHNPDPGRIKAEVLWQLELTREEDLASRKKHFRALCLRWHPDKTQNDRDLATEIFKFLLQQRAAYLGE